MRLNIFLFLILLIVIIYLVYKYFEADPDKAIKNTESVFEQLSSLPDTEVINIIAEVPLDDHVGRFVQAATVEHVLGDADIAHDLYIQMLTDVFNNGDFHDVAIAVGPVRFNDVANELHFPTPVNTEFAVRSDSQNVHDSNLQDKMVEKYNRLKQINGKINYKDLRDSLSAEVELQNSIPIKIVYNRMINGSPIVSLGDTEDKVLLNVWNRAKDNPDLGISLFDAMKDSFNPKSMSPHCLGGRVSRVLESFTKVDTDPILNDGGVTVEILRKEMYDRSSIIVKEELDKLSSDDLSKYNKGDNVVGDKIKESLGSRLHNEYESLAKETRLNKIIDDISESL
jgi:hypothetical protein